jgi:putative zinc finger/helix-turn-helix YgiT family protein
MKCFVCEIGTLQPKITVAEGEVKKKKYNVETRALVCDSCGHVALEGRDAQEFMRLIADAYRSENDLLTSDQIRQLRGDLSQKKFAAILGLGVASIKRWELGLIQDKKSNKTMRDYAASRTPKWASYRYESQPRHWAEAEVLEEHSHGPPWQIENLHSFALCTINSNDRFPR